MASAAKATKTLDVICPECLDPGNAISLKLDELPTCVCECGEEFTPEDAAGRFQAMFSRWVRVANWIADAPVEGEA